MRFVAGMIRCGCCCLGIYLITLIVGIATDGKLSIKLVHFENRKSMLPDGSCCDGNVGGTSQCNLCEYSFAICASGNGSRPCSICSYRTAEHSSAEHIAFGSKIEMPDYTFVSNPLQCTIGRWNGTLSIGITAYDEDAGSSDIVSEMAQSVTINATKYGFTKTKPVLLEGKRRSDVTPKLTMNISVECNQHYLIPTCEEYCTDTDDATGHYKCNYDTGIRECLPGWYGAKCTNKVIFCTPRNDTQGHYSCDPMTGEKICLPGWKNVTTNCTQAIIRKASPLPSTTEILLQSFPSSITRIGESTYQITSLHTPGKSAYPLHSSRLHSILLTKVTYLSTNNLLTEATYLSTVQHSPTNKAGITATSHHTSQDYSHLKSTTNPISQSSFTATPAITKFATSHIEMVSYSSQLSQQHISSSLVESKSSTSSAATIAFEAIPSVSTESKVKRATQVLFSEPTINAGVRYSNGTTLVQNSRTVSLGVLSKTSANTRSPASSMKNVIPTKNPVKSSTQPTTGAAKHTEKRKSVFDVSKLIAIGLSALVLIILFVTVVVLNKRKHRVQRIDPKSIARRYKRSSAGFTAASNPSISSASTSLSMGSMLEKRVGKGSYMMQEYPSKPPSAASGCAETSMNSPSHMNKLSVDQWSTCSGKTSQSSSSKDMGAQYPRGGYELLKTSAQVESAFISNERCNDVTSSHPFIILPTARHQKMSL